MSQTIKINAIVLFVMALCTPVFAYLPGEERDENIRKTLEILHKDNPEVLKEYSPVSAGAPIQRSEHQFEVGTEVSHIKYTEPGYGVKDEGMMYGIFANYNYRPEENPTEGIIDVYHLDAHFNVGQLDYSGSGTIDDVENYMIEPRFWMGKDIVAGPVRLTPYAGIGYRFLHDDSGGEITSTGFYGYDRRSQYLYAPAGVEFNVQAGNGWEVGFTGEYDHLIRGWQTSYLSDLGGPDVENIQRKGYGIKGAINIVKKFDNMNLTLSPYIRYWNIKQSDSVFFIDPDDFSVIEVFEPANKSVEIGGRIGIQF